MDYGKKFDHFFNKNEIIFFTNEIDLSSKLSFYKENQNLAKKIAFNGKKKYFELFNGKEVANYIINRSLNYNIKYKPIWEKKILK